MHFERAIGERILLHGKYAYSGVLREVVGKWLVLYDAWLHTWTDADVRVRSTGHPPVYCGDECAVNSDYVESCVREAFLSWADEESSIREGKRTKKAKQEA